MIIYYSENILHLRKYIFCFYKVKLIVFFLLVTPIIGNHKYYYRSPLTGYLHIPTPALPKHCYLQFDYVGGARAD